MNSKLFSRVNDFIAGSKNEITLNIKDFYPDIVKKNWNIKTILACKEIVQLISFSPISISLDSVIRINSTSTKRPAPRYINNYLTSSSFELPEIHLKKGDIALPCNCELVQKLSTDTGLNVYYKQEYFELWDIYLREIHIRWNR